LSNGTGATKEAKEKLHKAMVLLNLVSLNEMESESESQEEDDEEGNKPENSPQEECDKANDDIDEDVGNDDGLKSKEICFLRN
jgi:hypothetical protein